MAGYRLAARSAVVCEKQVYQLLVNGTAGGVLLRLAYLRLIFGRSGAVRECPPYFSILCVGKKFRVRPKAPDGG